MHSPETPYVRAPGYAEHYRDRRFTTGSGARTHRLEARAIDVLLRNARTLPGPWLDVPCGTGRMSELLPGPVIQVDRDLAMVRACPDGKTRVCASVHRLPFADGVFAGTLCMRLLHHIESPEERLVILRELRRVCRGPLIVSFFHSLSLQHLRRCVARRMGKTRSGRHALRFGVFRSELEAAGLRVVMTKPLARFVSEQWLVLATPSPASL